MIRISFACSPRALFLAIVVLATIVNIFFSWPLNLEYPLSWTNRGYQVPGDAVIPLKPYLKGVAVAGYYTDRFRPGFWYQPELAYYLQSYQYTISPVMLDWDHRDRYEYILFDCRVPRCYEKEPLPFPVKMVFSIDDKIALLQRTVAP